MKCEPLQAYAVVHRRGGRRAHVRCFGRRWYIEAFLSRCLSISAKNTESRRAGSNRLPLLITSVRCTSALFAKLPIPSGLSPSDSCQYLSDAERTSGLRRERRVVEPSPLAQPCQQLEEGFFGAPLGRPTEPPLGTARVHNGGGER